MTAETLSMRFLAGAALGKAIREVAGGTRVACAVAFWGRGSEGTIGNPTGRDVRLICNLEMGGTNPAAIRALMMLGISVKQCSRLHAKVYIGDKEAVVTSANSSINGLGLEGDAVANWIETGVLIPAEAALAWFDELWQNSHLVTDPDLKRAELLFQRRRLIVPTQDFTAFDPGDDDFPLIDYDGFADFVLDHKMLKQELGEEDYNKHEPNFDKSIEVAFPKERAILRQGRRVLRWQPRTDGYPNQRAAPWWIVSSGRYVADGMAFKNGERRGVMLAEDPQRISEPFSTRDPHFRQKFNEVISQEKYDDLRTFEWTGSFYSTSRLRLMRQFWDDLRQAARRSASLP